MARFANNSPQRDAESLELDFGLPGACMAHGRTAVRFHERALCFYGTDNGLVQVTPKSSGLNTLRMKIPWLRVWFIKATLHGSWPACAACCRRTRWMRLTSALIALSGLLTIFGLFAATQSGVDSIPAWVFVALFPGWLPCGLLVAMILFEYSHPRVRVRPIADTSSIIVSVHPDFAAALRQHSAATDISPADKPCTPIFFD